MQLTIHFEGVRVLHCGLMFLAALGVKTQISPWPGLCALDPCSFDCGCSCPVGVVDWSGLLPCCMARREHHLRASQVAHCLGQWRLLALMMSPCHWYLVRRRLVLTAARAKKQVVGAELSCVRSTLAAFGTYVFFLLFGACRPTYLDTLGSWLWLRPARSVCKARWG